MLENILWAVLFGGFPTSAVYLVKYGRTLFARRRELRAQPDPEAAHAQDRAEVWFGLYWVVWAGFGLFICQALKTTMHAH